MVLSRGVASKREKELVSMNRPIEKEVVQIEIGELNWENSKRRYAIIVHLELKIHVTKCKS